MAWGIYDTQAQAWAGNEDGPAEYEDKLLAQACAQIAEMALTGTDLGKRLEVREIPASCHWLLRDRIPYKHDPEEALRRIEGEVDAGD